MKALKSLIVTLVLVFVAAAEYFLIFNFFDIYDALSDTNVFIWIAGYSLLILGIEAAAMLLVTLAETVLLVISKIRRRELKVPFALLLSGANFLLLMLSVYFIIDDLFVPHPEAIISMRGFGTQIMLMSLTPISIIFMVGSAVIFFIRRKKATK